MRSGVRLRVRWGVMPWGGGYKGKVIEGWRWMYGYTGRRPGTSERARASARETSARKGEYATTWESDGRGDGLG